ncbi:MULTISPECIES: hypothetical protein [unclassified Pseudomonas]|jgi:hypothetical protein|uniref:hypothetical protein n=1 Tax=unclassified Pseudomonas TaxID=196821 RepID=UPI0011AF1BB1|nr:MULTISPECIES: hypothetical protein [unclassified Pseudomonas]
MATSETALQNCPKPGQSTLSHTLAMGLKYLDKNRRPAISDTAYSDVPQIARNEAKVLQICGHYAQAGNVVWKMRLSTVSQDTDTARGRLEGQRYT